jgi:hypothetical protein
MSAKTTLVDSIGVSSIDPRQEIPVSIYTRGRGVEERMMPFGTLCSWCDDAGVPVEVVEKVPSSEKNIDKGGEGCFSTRMKVFICLSDIETLH